MRLIGIHPLVKVRAMREEVGDHVCKTRDMGKSIGEVLKESDPTGLMASNFLWFAEILEVFMVCVNLNGMLCAEEEWLTTFEAKDDCGQFFIIDIIVLLGR
jgi:hypothetical protein